MIKKKPSFFVGIAVLVVVFIVFLLYATSLPFMPLNMLMHSSPTITGHVSGSLLRGIRITGLKIKATPAGFINAREVNFRYRGGQYLFHQKLIVDNLSIVDFVANLPNGTLPNEKDIRKQIQRRLFLVPPIPGLSTLSGIHLRNVLILNTHINTNNPFDLLMSVLSLAGHCKAASLFQIDNFRMGDFYYQFLPNPQPTVKELSIGGVRIAKGGVNLGHAQVQSNNFLFALNCLKPGPNIDAVIANCNGVLKKTANQNLKQDIPFSGHLEKGHFVLSAFNGKCVLHMASKTGNQPSAFDLKAPMLDLSDYFIHMAPVSNINVQGGNIFTNNVDRFSCRIGEGNFIGATAKLFVPNKPNAPKLLGQGLLNGSGKVLAAIFMDALTPGNVRIFLRENGAQTSAKFLLSEVWFKKSFASLNRNELETLKALAPYFGIGPKDLQTAAIPNSNYKT